MKYYLAALALILALWQIAALIVNKPYLPAFTDVIIRASQDAPILVNNLVATLTRVAISVAVALVAGLAAGLAAVWLSERVSANLLKALILLTYPRELK